jgi:hypothetical protein
LDVGFVSDLVRYFVCARKPGVGQRNKRRRALLADNKSIRQYDWNAGGKICGDSCTESLIVAASRISRPAVSVTEREISANGRPAHIAVEHMPSTARNQEFLPRATRRIGLCFDVFEAEAFQCEDQAFPTVSA